MKKILLVTLLAITGCTASQIPKDTFIYKGENDHKIRTFGNMNGYSVSEDEIAEGRTKCANYKRLLISDGEKEVMTRLAYDCEQSKDKEIYILHIWNINYAYNLFYTLREEYRKGDPEYDFTLSSIFPSCWDRDNVKMNCFYCCQLYLKCNAVTLFNKKEANKYVEEHHKLLSI
jgi:hypothetical protein